MLNVNDLRNGTVFSEDNQLFQVINFEHIKMGRGSGNVKVKVKNLRTGSIVEKSFITGARVDEANVEKKKAQYLYNDGENYKRSLKASPQDELSGSAYNFMDPSSFEQFPISEAILSDNAKYLKEGLEVVLIVTGDEALGIELPNSIVYEIVETGPEEKGNTVSNVYKEAVMDNGLVAKVPMFMSAGEKVKIDTRTGQYVERVK